MAATAVLDTNVLSYLARAEPTIAPRFASWLAAGNGVVLSRVSVYEFRRGIYAGSIGTAEGEAGELVLVNFGIVEVDEDTWNEAARIWGAMARAGKKTRGMDADILIAATAVRWGYEVATRNVSDFEKIVEVSSGLIVHGW